MTDLFTLMSSPMPREQKLELALRMARSWMQCVEPRLLDTPNFRRDMETLDAALSTPKAEAVAVGSLVWDSPIEGSYRATAIGLRYYVYLNSDDGLWHMYSEGYQPVNGEFATSKEAKAAAQANYEARILSAIDTSPVPALTDEAVERAKRAITALRKPDASLSRVPNTVRQSIAEVVEDLLAAFPSTGGDNGQA